MHWNSDAEIRYLSLPAQKSGFLRIALMLALILSFEGPCTGPRGVLQVGVVPGGLGDPQVAGKELSER